MGLPDCKGYGVPVRQKDHPRRFGRQKHSPGGTQRRQDLRLRLGQEHVLAVLLPEEDRSKPT